MLMYLESLIFVIMLGLIMRFPKQDVYKVITAVGGFVLCLINFFAIPHLEDKQKKEELTKSNDE